MAYDNRQLVHVWAQQTKSTGRNGRGDSLHFTGRSLYSYRTEIARFIEGRAVYTSHRYSVTTTGKHAIHIPGAVSHIENYRVSVEMKHIPDRWESAAPIIFRDMLEHLHGHIGAIVRARTSAEFLIDRLAESAQKAYQFFGSYIADTAHRKVFEGRTESRISIADLVALSSNVAGTDLAAVISDRFGADVREKIAKQRAAAKERREREARNLAAVIAEWRAGETSASIHGAPVMLRVSRNGLGAVIETSHGARVGFREAIHLYRAVKSGINVIGRKIGEFTVNAVTDTEITIGCHRIPMEEVERIFKNTDGLRVA